MLDGTVWLITVPTALLQMRGSPPRLSNLFFPAKMGLSVRPTCLLAHFTGSRVPQRRAPVMAE